MISGPRIFINKQKLPTNAALLTNEILMLVISGSMEGQGRK